MECERTRVRVYAAREELARDGTRCARTMSASNGRSNDELSVPASSGKRSRDVGDGADDAIDARNFKRAARLSQKELQTKIKSLRDEADLKSHEGRRRFLKQISPLTDDWTGDYQDLRDIFPKEDVECLLSESMCIWAEYDESPGKFVRLVVRVGYRDESGNTPLHWALSQGRRYLAAVLLKNGADPNSDNWKGSSPLHFASKAGNRDAADLAWTLFEHVDYVKHPQGLRVSAQDGFGCTPLHFAVNAGNQKLSELLLRRGADPNLPNMNGLTPLHVMCDHRADYDFMEAFFKTCDKIPRTVEVNRRDKDGNTPLHIAASHSSNDIVELLLKRNAHPNWANNAGSTPLHNICTRYGRDYRCSLVKLFFRINEEKQQAVRVNFQNKSGWSPLHYALYHGDGAVAALLLKKGADPNLANAVEGSTPLHIISKTSDGQPGLADLFFKICDEKQLLVKVDVRDMKGRTPLQRAVANIKPDVVDVLLRRGADLSSFVFPTKSYFGKSFKLRTRGDNFGLRLASGALMVAELLEEKEYELDRSDALTIMKFFAKQKVFAESMDLIEKSWHRNDYFVKTTKEKMVIPSLSFYDLIQLQPDEASKLLTTAHYYELAESRIWAALPEKQSKACVLYLSELMSRRFFRSWASDPFWQLIHHRLPILCCDLILDTLMNQDLLLYFLATHIYISICGTLIRRAIFCSSPINKRIYDQFFYDFTWRTRDTYLFKRLENLRNTTTDAAAALLQLAMTNEVDVEEFVLKKTSYGTFVSKTGLEFVLMADGSYVLGSTLNPQQANAPGSNSVVNVSGNIGKIEEFQGGSDWSIYNERLEQYFSANFVEDQRKVSVLLTSIGSSVCTKLYEICVAQLCLKKNLTKICVISLKSIILRVSQFTRSVDSFIVSFKDPSENVSQWYARVKKGAVECQFGAELDNRIKDQFVSGLKEGKILDRIFEENHSTPLADTLEIALKKEASLMLSSTTSAEIK
ncbi:unnamed protein product [Trichogramma brassicae]|uniref:Uncharacterized protein n=1 Tax=Trichogramma brassicae TaxID=86971 RepID=A0A6H5J351_9HYME|nr:unnamed protein product [Trichogramma brassicae]